MDTDIQADRDLRILIIDDQKHDREIIKYHLAKTTHAASRHVQITEMDNAEDVREVLAKHADKYDCIFMDYLMPQLNGLQILEYLKNNAANDLLPPIIMLTGHNDESVVVKALKFGAMDYLTKDNISPATIDIAITKAMMMHHLKELHIKAEHQLRQTQKLDAIGQLTSGVAHDFNNLLTIILGNTRLIRKKIKNGEIDIDDRIVLIENTARKGAELVRRLMVFSRQNPKASTNINIGEAVDQLHKLLEHTLDETIKLYTVMDGNLPMVSIDAGQFENMLVNMAINARDAMPDGGKITLEVRTVNLDEDYCQLYTNLSPGPHVLLAISDTGTGIPPEICQKIFDPFFTTKDVDKGTGLGLSMAYGCVRDAGGDIHVYSEEDKGTVFRIYLPAHDPDVHNITRNNNIKKDWYGNKEVVLVVDDDPRNCDMASIMLERLGYISMTAHSGEKALEILASKEMKIDMVLSDVFMKDGMSGIELVEKIKSTYPEVAILLMTGFTESTLSAYDMIRDYKILAKPLFKDQLAPMMKMILETHKESVGAKDEK